MDQNPEIAQLPVEWAAVQKAWPLQPVNNLHRLWDIWRSLHSAQAPNTKLSYASSRKKFCDWMEGKDLCPRTMIEWVVWLQTAQIDRSGKLLGLGKLNKYVLHARAFVRWLKALGYITHDPCAVLPPVRSEPPKPAQIWTHAEYVQIQSYCRNKIWAQPYAWLIMLGYRTGLSLVDCAYLRWSEVFLHDDKPSYIRRVRQKLAFRGEKAVCVIPIVARSDVHEMLLLLQSTRHLNTMVHDDCPDPVHQNGPTIYKSTWFKCHRAFKSIFFKALKHMGGYRDRTFRHLRQTFCTNLMNSGAEAALVCKMTGHANVQMLARYLQPDIKVLEEQLARSFRFAEEQSGSKVILPIDHNRIV